MMQIKDFIQGWFRAEIAISLVAALFGVLLIWNPAGLYPWLKAMHVIAVIAYHAESEAGSQQSETFKVMERRLLRAIINPAMIATWVLGLWLAWQGGFFKSGWLHGKLVLVVVLSGLHGALSRWLREFAEDRNVHSPRFYRIVNEIPAVLMVGIVILVIVKPF
jgi:putative membrane protein